MNRESHQNRKKLIDHHKVNSHHQHQNNESARTD